MSDELRTYDPYEVPALAEDSRFAFLATTPAGWNDSAAGVLATVFGNLVEDRIADAKAAEPEAVSVRLRAVVRTADGYALAERGVIEGVPEFRSKRPGKMWKKLRDGSLLDSAFLGGDAYELAPDAEVWAALLTTAERVGAKSDELRTLNNATARLLLARAGLNVHPGALPNVEDVVAEPVEG